MPAVKRIVIMGAAGRDFHDFNVVFRDDPACEVLAFTAAQIPAIAGRVYPPVLAGPRYPQGIPIVPEAELARLIETRDVDEVVFAYSDVSHEAVMHRASLAIALGADFRLLGARSTMLRAARPVVSICAVRTGCGKSPATRRIAGTLRAAGLRVGVVRHPMPYGDLAAQAVQRFASTADLDAARCTLEEREEYEPHIAAGQVVYAGVDYARLLRLVERESDVIVWDGGNNDLPFFVPDLELVLADPQRAGHERTYHPGEANLLRADVVVLTKLDSAQPDDAGRLRASVRAANPRAAIVESAMPAVADAPERIAGARVLVVEDGPTLTHGGMAFGAGALVARGHGAAELVDPRPYAVGSLREVFATNPHIGPVLPAMGYGEAQIGELAATIAAAPCDLVLIASPVDLRRLIAIRQPTTRVSYAFEEIGVPRLPALLAPIIERARKTGASASAPPRDG
ncbi:MAG: GTPase [Burkholderiales bacterium]|nr:GTPase [Burkholderiales bacterium]